MGWPPEDPDEWAAEAWIKGPKDKENRTAKFVIFEGILPENKGCRFYTLNNPHQTELEKCTLDDGQVAYKVVTYVDTKEEAEIVLFGRVIG